MTHAYLGNNIIVSKWINKDIFHFIAENDNVKIAFKKNGENNSRFNYSINGIIWNEYELDSEITINNGQKLYFKAVDNNTTCENLYFSIEGGKAGCYGNIMYLLNKNGQANLVEKCFKELFFDVEEFNNFYLTHAPDLPATNLVKNCYEGMFANCRTLSTAPALPATNLADQCYYGMFQGCTSLSTTPALPATTLVAGCYKDMFYGCTSLNSVSVGLSSWNDSNQSTHNWLYEVSPTGDFYCPNTLPEIRDESHIPTNWNIHSPEIDIPENMLRFSATKPNSSICLNDVYGNYKTSKNKRGWFTYPLSTTINLDEGDTLYFSAISSNLSCCDQHVYKIRFTMTGEISASGNIQYLLDSTGTQLSVPNYAYELLFNNCSSLIHAPDLPASVLAINCYSNMFFDCTSLSTAPELPATNLIRECYFNMFYNCTALSTAPALPASILNDYCYSGMFSRCKSLTTAPALPATTLASNCYWGMFSGCTSLTSAPALPATTLASNCYWGMFSGCTSLTTTPALPATTLAQGCYWEMFSGCTSLSTAPYILATSLAPYCCQGMFYGCSSLNSVSVGLSSWEGINSPTYYWLYKVSPNGDFYCPAELSDIRGNSYIPEGWNIHRQTPPINRLYFTTSNENGGSVQLNDAEGSYVYSTDGNSYSDYVMNTPISLQKDEKVYIKAKTTNNSVQNSGLSARFVMDGDISAYGNIQYLLDSNGTSLIVPDNAFNQIFRDCSALVTAPDMPATTLGVGSYKGMYSGCGNLREVSDISATQLSDYCCEYMFEECYALTNAPKLYATSLNKDCYANMFRDCSSLTSTNELIASSLAEGCYGSMFYGCTALSNAPLLSVQTLTEECYYRMFENCTSLTSAPVLPAETLINKCYYGMFNGCSVLNYISTDMNSWVDNATTDWVAGVAEEGLFRTKYNIAEIRGNSNIPSKWSLNGQIVIPDNMLRFSATKPDSSIKLENVYGTYKYSVNKNEWNTYPLSTTINLNEGDTLYFSAVSSNENCSIESNKSVFTMTGEISASGNIQYLLDSTGTRLSVPEYAYTYLFRGCSSLIHAPDLSATALAKNCYFKMFYDCTSLSTAPVLPATLLSFHCYASMFQGCTSLSTAPVLPATKILEDGCYANMFTNCSSLNSISVDLSSWNDNIYSTNNWLYDVSLTGDFYCPNTLPEIRDESHIPTNWSVNRMFNVKEDSLKFTATKPSTIKLENVEGTYNYSTDGKYCNTYNLGDTISLNEGQSLYLFAQSKNSACSNQDDTPKFSMTGEISASGNIQYLLDSTGTQLSVPENGFYGLFRNCSALITMPTIPANQLGSNSYSYMCENCTNLSSISPFPVMQNEAYCFANGMFKNCSALKISDVEPETKTHEFIVRLTNVVDDTWGIRMFEGTSGSFTGTPLANTTYYVISDPLPTGLLMTSLNGNVYSFEKPSVLNYNSDIYRVGDLTDRNNLVKVIDNTGTQTGVDIATKSFKDCKNLEYYDVKCNNYIGDYAFGGCLKLSTITYITDETKSNWLSSIGKGAFGGTSISSAEIGKDTIYDKYIKRGAFSGCSALISCTIYDDVQLGVAQSSLPKGMRGGIITPSDSDLLGVFVNCQNLETVKLHDVTYITNSAFMDCKKLKNIYLYFIPSQTHAVPTLEAYAFGGCENMVKVYVNNHEVYRGMKYGTTLWKTNEEQGKILIEEI